MSGGSGGGGAGRGGAGGAVKGEERSDNFWDVTQRWNAGWRRATSKMNELKKYISLPAPDSFSFLLLLCIIQVDRMVKKKNEQEKKNPARL